ncbi:MAG: hypothetical protein R3F30_00795 [Planctomycetota bacterium]
MGIRDLGFRRYEGARTSTTARVRYLAWAEVRRTFAAKRFVLFYLFCLMPLYVSFVIMYMLMVLGDGEHMSMGGGGMRRRGMASLALDEPGFYFWPMVGAGFALVWLFSAVVSAGMVSRDRGANALELYFTRGLRPVHYFAGKWLAAFALMCGQLVLPYLALWIFAVFLAPDWDFLARTLPWIPAYLLATVFVALSVSWLATCLSCSTSSVRFAVLRWVGGLFGLFLLGRVLTRTMGQDEWLLVSPWDVIVRIGHWLADVRTIHDFTLEYAILAWVGLVVGAGLFAWRRLEPVEVVA